MKFREVEVCAGLSQLFMRLLGTLDTKGVLNRAETLQIFDEAAAALRLRLDDPINVQAAAFVDMLSAEAREKN
jgi:hypothetical protein